MAIRITCIKKDSGNHESELTTINELGWINEATNEKGRSSREAMYNWVKIPSNSAYVKDVYGNKAELEAKETDKECNSQYLI